MDTTVQILDRINALKGWTDYRTAKALGVHTSSTSAWRRKGVVMSDETGLKAAEILGIRPKFLIASLMMERTLNSPVFDVIKEIVDDLEAMEKGENHDQNTQKRSNVA